MIVLRERKHSVYTVLDQLANGLCVLISLILGLVVRRRIVGDSNLWITVSRYQQCQTSDGCRIEKNNATNLIEMSRRLQTTDGNVFRNAAKLPSIIQTNSTSSSSVLQGADEQS